MSFFRELKRRNVFRVGAAYAVTAWVLLQVLDVVGEILELPAWGGKLILLVLVAGFFVALFVAWAFELTPQGIKRESEVDRSQSITPQTGRRLDRFIIVALAVAVGYLLVDKFFLQERIAAPTSTPTVAEAEPVAAGDPSVAVLPFVNMSGDADNEYFSDGLTETLLHVLAQLPGLRVAARTSSFAFKGQNTDIGEIAATLGVAHLLEGSVQKADDRVRVTAQLIRAEDGFHVWSQSYTRPLEDIFAIQDEIAADVARALGGSLLDDPESETHVVSTQDLDAYDSFLKGLEQQAIYSYTSLDLAERQFKQALVHDPGFTEARLALARNHILKYETGLIDADTLKARVEPLIEQVRATDPDNARARVFELTVRLRTSSSGTPEEMRRIVEELLTKLERVPDEVTARLYAAAAFMYYFNDHERAVEVLQGGLLIDPLQHELYRWLARAYLEGRQLDAAREASLRSIELEPEAPNHYGTMAEIELASDDLAAGLEWGRRASEVDPQDHEIAFQMAHRLYLLGLNEEADPWRARVQALAPESGVARLLDVDRAAARGDLDAVIELSAAMIEDQVDQRHGAFDTALVYYADAMQRSGRSREGYDFLLGVNPEIANLDEVPEDPRGISMQWALLDLMSGFASFEERKAAWIRFDESLARMGYPEKRDPEAEYQVWNLVMRGETEQAIEHFLEHGLATPLAEWLERPQRQFPLTLGEVYADPRVDAALNGDERRLQEFRDEVQAMLQGPEWVDQ